tara:strand:+ start:340 stop:615 length:276 start_codon:yes stop_codon:yes gene_type:complete
MSDRPEVKLADWISFGSTIFSKSAVVCKVYADSRSADIEVVYLDNQGRAINEDMVWEDGEWKFVIAGPCGGYADKKPRLTTFVTILRRGRC